MEASGPKAPKADSEEKGQGERQQLGAEEEVLVSGAPKSIGRATKRVSAGLPADLLPPSVPLPPSLPKLLEGAAPLPTAPPPLPLPTLSEAPTLPDLPLPRVPALPDSTGKINGGKSEGEGTPLESGKGQRRSKEENRVEDEGKSSAQSKDHEECTSEGRGEEAGQTARGSSSWRDLLTCLLLIGLCNAPAAWFTYSRLNQGPVLPKTAEEAGTAGFAEERAMAHVKYLAGDIGFRQEGTQGLMDARHYILDTVLSIQSKAGPRLRVEVDVRDNFTGSFNLVFLQKSMAMAYQNLTNVMVRVSAADVYADVTPSVMVNGHFDSAIASQGASDCASCVATMLESLRQIVEGDLVPPSPMVFLFNGGEEIFLKASHGFLSQHPWSHTVGAFVNLEAAGTRLPDLLVQSGAPWVQRVYGATVPYPMASVIAQDVFPHIPGDTDWRIMCQDFDDIPGLDIMLTLNGYAYHTKLDSPENLMPGALQVRGENLLPLLWGLGEAPELMTRSERRTARWSRPQPDAYNRRNSSAVDYTPGMAGPEAMMQGGGEPVFFDVLWGVMVGYSHRTAVGFLTALLGILMLSPVVATQKTSGCHGALARLDQLVVGCLCYLASWILALVFPVALAVLRVWASQAPMSWYAEPTWAFAAYLPISVVGILLPHTLRASLLASDTTPYARERVEWSAHWGGVLGCNLLISLLITASGLGGGYLMFWWAVFLTPSLFLARRLQAIFGKDSPLSTLGFLVPASVPAAYSMGFLQFTSRMLAEKMGQSGTHPLPIGLFVPDIIIAVVVGICGALCLAPYAAAFSRWVCRGNVLRVLLYASLIASAQMCSKFPYSQATPKRVVLARSYATEGPDTMLSAQTVVAAADANDASFVLKHAPLFRRAVLRSSPGFKGLEGWQESGLPAGMYEASPSTLLAKYPINDLLDRPAGISAPLWQGSQRGVKFPELQVLREETVASPDETQPWLMRRRVHVHVHSGSLSEVWGAVLNITGPLSGWSMAEGKLPAPEFSRTGGPPSYILHFGGGNGQIHWNFWLEASSSKKLMVEMALMDHRIDEDMKEIVNTVPDWMALYPVTSYRSVYRL